MLKAGILSDLSARSIRHPGESATDWTHYLNHHWRKEWWTQAGEFQRITSLTRIILCVQFVHSTKLLLILLFRPSATWQNVSSALGHLESSSRCDCLFVYRCNLDHVAIYIFWCCPLVTCKQAKCLETGETVAIKKVLQDIRYKNRELQLMRLMGHPNVISLKHCFFSTTNKDELFLNLVMDFVPETLYRVSKHYSNVNRGMPLIYVKLYMYQVCVANFTFSGTFRRSVTEVTTWLSSADI